jgi:Domain of unknown function (DUF222)
VFDDGVRTAAVGAHGTDRRAGLSSPDDLLDRIAADDREIAAIQARQLTRIAAFARSRPALLGERVVDGASEFAADELAAELRLSRQAAAARIHLAVTLTERLPGTAAALAAGALDLAKTRAVVDATDPLDAPVALAVEQRVLPKAPTQTAGQLRVALTRAVLAADPAGAQTRHESAVAARRVEITAHPDGMAELWAFLPAPAATAIYTTLDHYARRPGQPADTPIDARRADALTALVLGPAARAAHHPGATIHDRPPAHAAAQRSGSHAACVAPAQAAGPPGVRAARVSPAQAAGLPGVRGARVSPAQAAGPPGVRGAHVLPAHAAAGPADARGRPVAPVGAAARSVEARERAEVPAETSSSVVPPVDMTAAVPLAPLVQVTVAASTLLRLDDQPAELAGHGPIPAEVARQLAADPTGTWRRILTDPGTGTVLDVGHRSYRPPRPLARLLTARDVTCRFPGCRRPSRRCDLDHVTPWPIGPTAASNLISLCRHHHRLKHASRWTVTTDHTGTVVWTAPTGRSYSTRPPPLADPVPPAGQRHAVPG